jgi:hypothetical protein
MRISPGQITPDDDRLMQELTCRRCATTVLVRKNTLSQTSIQWLADAGRTCTELAERRAAGTSTGLAAGCTALRESIEDAVRDGRLPVLSHE